MGTKLTNLESVEPADTEKLAALGIATTDEFLGAAANASDRMALSTKSGVANAVLDRLAGIADLMRIAGISEPSALLLAALDAPTAPQLATREAPILVKQLRRKNVELLLARGLPPESIVARWIEDAKKLPPAAMV